MSPGRRQALFADQAEFGTTAGNRIRGSAIVVESENCYIQGDKRVVAAVGVSNLLIVDTGDAVLVADRERSQQVKLVVDQLRASNHDAARFHQTVHRPWGSFTVLEDAADCKVKRLTVKPGGVLSLQFSHTGRLSLTLIDIDDDEDEARIVLFKEGHIVDEILADKTGDNGVEHLDLGASGEIDAAEIHLEGSAGVAAIQLDVMLVGTEPQTWSKVKSSYR